MTDSPTTHTPHEPASGATEPDHINIRSIVSFGIGLTVVAAAAHVSMLLMFNGLAKSIDASNPPRTYPIAVLDDDRRPPEPRLQGGVDSDAGRLRGEGEARERNLGPKEALIDLRAEEDALLQSYGWVDHGNNIVRIPIEEAMKLTLQRGLPSRGQTPAGAPATQATPAAQEQR